MSQHKYEARTKNINKIHKAINKHGWENVTKELLCSGLSKSSAMKMEISLIGELNSMESGYNTTPGGQMVNEHCSAQMTKRMSNPEYREKCVTALHSNEKQRLSKLASCETRALNSAAQKKRYIEGKCKLPNRSKAVVCVETGEKFDSILAAAKHFGGRREHLRDHLIGRRGRPRFKGLHFEYA